MSLRRVKFGRVLALLAAVVTAALAYFSPVSTTSSDPQFGLLVSQTMLRYQTLQMDIYQETIAPILSRAFVILDGNIYYYFPLGTPIFSMPAVGVANLLGYDMANAVQEAAVQNALSAVLVGLSFLVIYHICRCFLPEGVSLFLTAATFLGSALISTMSTALWSIDFAVLFVSLSLLILSRQANGEQRRFQPYLLGFTLFGAYLCRPSTFLFVGLVLGYLFFVDRKRFWPTAVLAFVLLAGFLIFIRLGYGSWLPPYYNDFGRLAVERRPLYEAFFGNLVSPSRGLLVYSPFFGLTLVGAGAYFTRLRRRPLYWLVLSWFVLQLLLVARTTRWWGGLSFGPRILTELLPGLVLLTAVVGQVFLESERRRRLRFAIVGVFGGLAVWAIFLNSYQGLFNQYTAWWHSALTPNIDYEPDYLWDWEHAQFLAGNESLCRRDKEYIERILMNEELGRHLFPYQVGRPLDITPNEPLLLYEILEGSLETAEDASRLIALPDKRVNFLPILIQEGENNLDFVLSGFSNPQFGYRWTMCEMAAIAFKLDSRAAADKVYTLSIHSGSFGRQRVNVMVNGVALGEIEFNGVAQPPVVKEVIIPAGVLMPGKVNQIVMTLPDSIIPNLPNEDRRVGLSFISITLQASPN